MKVTILPGDGIGPEVTNEAIRVLSAVCGHYSIVLETDTHLIGGAAIKAEGTPLPQATADACSISDAVLLGAVGDPVYDNELPEDRPEKGLLELRQLLGGFANLRPSRAVSALVDSSPLKREIFEGTDLLIVRELLGGMYFGEPRGFSEDKTEAFNTKRYTKAEIERVAHVAFKTAEKRRGRLTSVDKANVLECSQLWRKTVEEVAVGYPDVELDHLFVDACAMHLVTDPRRFDVILTENLFGDILSDEAAVLTGSLGMLSSATIGGSVDLYEPVHGSAPDIAGKGIANPLGAIASAAMLLRYTAKNEEAAQAIESAIDRVLEEGYRTADIVGSEKDKRISTGELGKLVEDYTLEKVALRQVAA